VVLADPEVEPASGAAARRPRRTARNGKAAPATKAPAAKGRTSRQPTASRAKNEGSSKGKVRRSATSAKGTKGKSTKGTTKSGSKAASSAVVRPRRRGGTQPTLGFEASAPQQQAVKSAQPARRKARAVPEAPVAAAPTTETALDTPARPARKRAAPGAPRTGRRATAESLADKQREISVSEFFTKNRHLLGFDSPARALLTTVKEAVDNSLDACEEAGILPELRVELVEVTDDRHRVIVEDNGPGIVKAQVPKVFGKLLYGSKFHRLRQSRGQQGIGISAAGMYGQLTTGKPIVIRSKTAKGKPAHHFEIVIDTAHNRPQIVADSTVEWNKDHGTRIEIELQGTYKGGRRSVDEYLEQVAIANPHAEIFYQPPKGRAPMHLQRVTNQLPDEPMEIKPHPYGVELGSLQRILKESGSRTLSGALQAEFSRVSAKVADELVKRAGLTGRARPHELKPGEIERLHAMIPQVKILAPPSNCVVPIGAGLIRKGLEREIQADFYTSSTRPPSVYRGNPFQVEAGLAYGGGLRGGYDEEETSPHESAKAADAQYGPITLLRLANRVPLQYQQSACVTFKAVVETNWRQYGLSQPRGGLPQGPMVLLVHIASVWVPFTSESKEAVAHYDEIIKEVRLALQECGRQLGRFLRQREHARREERRRSIFEMYIGELVESLGKLTRTNRERLQKQLLKLAAQHTDLGDENLEAAVQGTRRVHKQADEIEGEESE